MKKFRIVGLLLILVITSTLFEGCFRKGVNDPFISFRSRKARMTGIWDITEFNGIYHEKLNTGENRDIILHQTNKTISETTDYIKISQATQDSLGAGQDTSIEWKGQMIDSYYDIRDDGTFEFAYEYVLEKTHFKVFEEGSSTVGIFAPTSLPFRVDSTMSRNYRTEYRGRWNFLDDVDGYNNKERIIFEIENATYLTNYATTFVYDAEEDELTYPDPTDTTYSTQSLESVNHKYANGEFSILWEIDKLKNMEATFTRKLDHIYTHALTGTEGYKYTNKGSELVELIQEKK